MKSATAGWKRNLLHFWFHALSAAQRFGRDPAVDKLIVRHFVPVLTAMARRPVADFVTHPADALAAILLFDQVPRNAFRDSARAFAFDAKARAITHAALRRGWLHGLRTEERQFLLMPLMHSESIAEQRESLRRFTALGSPYIRNFALAHYRMVARFGRFPHRNAVLGRRSTPAEARAVAAGNHW